MKKPGSGHVERIGALIGDVVRPTIAARGLGQASLIAHWPDVVGAAVAKFAQPEQLQWPRGGDKRDPSRPNAPATLVLRIDGAFALEASHMSSTIIARVNAHLGWRCVNRVAFRQGPLLPPRLKPGKPAPPSAAALARAREMGADVADEGLRESLAQLGARIFDREAEERRQKQEDHDATGKSG